MAREPLYLRGRIWWCTVPRQGGGRRVPQSTGCRDRAAALLRWRDLERLAVSPAHRAEDAASLGDALDRRLEERRSAGRRPGTLSMLDVKGRQLTRVLGADTPLSHVTAAEVDRFVAARLAEGAARTTIAKELSTLRGALRLARRRGELTRGLDEIMPLDFSAEYKPKERALSADEIRRLLAELRPGRRATVAFLIATGATYPSELEGLIPGDVSWREWKVKIRGTKTATRDRVVPVVTFARPWLLLAKGKIPFASWSNVRRDLHAACARAKIPPCSPNDLRRTLANHLRARGVEPALLADVLGHADSRMAERVYGRLAPEQLAHLLSARLSATGRQKRRKRAKTSRKRG